MSRLALDPKPLVLQHLQWAIYLTYRDASRRVGKKIIVSAGDAAALHAYPCNLLRLSTLRAAMGQRHKQTIISDTFGFLAEFSNNIAGGVCQLKSNYG